jgi:hypothetical protein
LHRVGDDVYFLLHRSQIERDIEPQPVVHFDYDVCHDEWPKSGRGDGKLVAAAGQRQKAE